MQEIAKRLRLTEDWLYEDPWEAVGLALQDAFEEGSLESLRSGAMLTLKRKPRNGYPTPSGKIEFRSSRAVEMGLNPLPTQTPLRIPKGDFILLTSATPKYTSTQFQEVYGAIPAVVLVNSEDAERLGIESGDIVALSNDRGEVKVMLINHGPNTFYVNKGDRIAQMVVSSVVDGLNLMSQKVKTLDTTARGEGGFGSTGRN